jgi:hypothetical protein
MHNNNNMDMKMHTEEEMMAMDKKDLVKMIMDMQKMEKDDM